MNDSFFIFQSSVFIYFCVPLPYNARLAASLNFTLRNIRHFQILAAVFRDIVLAAGEDIAQQQKIVQGQISAKEAAKALDAKWATLK